MCVLDHQDYETKITEGQDFPSTSRLSLLMLFCFSFLNETQCYFLLLSMIKKQHVSEQM